MSKSRRFHLVPPVELDVETPLPLHRLQPSTSCSCQCRRGRVQGEPAPHRVPLARPTSDALLLDSREVARLLGIGRTKAFQLMARGEIPVVHIGRCVRVPREGLENWIRSVTGGGDLGSGR